MSQSMSSMVASLMLVIAGTASANMDLAKKNNCMACHAVDAKVIGPSFKSIAQKYKGTPSPQALLAQKIKKGGAGTWGNIPMPPNPNMSEADTTALIQWILSLD